MHICTYTTVTGCDQTGTDIRFGKNKLESFVL